MKHRTDQSILCQLKHEWGYSKKACDTCKTKFTCATRKVTPNDLRTHQLFSVPNTAEGQLFYSLARQYLNRDLFRFEAYGRGKRTTKTSSSHLRMKDCEWFSMYLIGKYGRIYQVGHNSGEYYQM